MGRRIRRIRFCGNCGVALEDAAAPREERKVTWLAVGLGRRQDAKPIIAACRAPRRRAVATAILSDDAAMAADLLAEIGHRPAEAYARLRAGGAHTNAALAFYRSVGATRYVREAEALLAASA